MILRPTRTFFQLFVNRTSQDIAVMAGPRKSHEALTSGVRVTLETPRGPFWPVIDSCPTFSPQRLRGTSWSRPRRSKSKRHDSDYC